MRWRKIGGGLVLGGLLAFVIWTGLFGGVQWDHWWYGVIAALLVALWLK